MFSETECQIMILGTRRSSQIQVKKNLSWKKKEEIKICDANCYNSWTFCSIFEKLKLCISYNFNTHIYYTR